MRRRARSTRASSPEAEQLDHGARIGAGEAVAFAARDREHGVLEQDEQAEGREDLHHRLVLQRLQHEALDHDAEHEQQRCHEEHRVVGPNPEFAKQKKVAYMREHHELALREVHDAHDAEDQVEADADKAVDPAEQDSRDQDVEEGFHRPARRQPGPQNEPGLDGVRRHLRGRLTSLTFGCAASFGNTVTILPDCHCTTVGNARVFWNLRVELQRRSRSRSSSPACPACAAAARTFSMSTEPAAAIASISICTPT